VADETYSTASELMRYKDVSREDNLRLGGRARLHLGEAISELVRLESLTKAAIRKLEKTRSNHPDRRHAEILEHIRYASEIRRMVKRLQLEGEAISWLTGLYHG
jgi:hypothetical protein